MHDLYLLTFNSIPCISTSTYIFHNTMQDYRHERGYRAGREGWVVQYSHVQVEGRVLQPTDNSASPPPSVASFLQPVAKQSDGSSTV